MFQPAAPGIFYNPPQPTQFVPRIVPGAPLAPPLRAPDQKAIYLWSQPTWYAQRPQINGTFSNPTFITRAPPQDAILRWPQLTWCAQKATINAWQPVQPTPPVPTTIGLSAAYLWSQPTWGNQTLPKAPIPLAPPVWSQQALQAQLIASWPQVTWSVQRLPTPVLAALTTPPQPWQPQPLNYLLTGLWPQLSWPSQTLPTVPPALGAKVSDPWPMRWPNPPVSQAQLRKYIESQRRAIKRRAKQIAAQVNYEEDLRKTVERAIRGEVEIEQVLEEAKAKPTPVSFRKADPQHVAFLARKLLERLPKVVLQDFKVQLPDLSQYQTPAAKILEALPDPEQADLEDLHELQSLYAQDFYERLETLQRLKRGKLN